MNMNIILLASTTAPVTFIPTTCQAVQLQAPGKRQPATEAKGVVLVCYVRKATSQWCSKRKTWWSTRSGAGSVDKLTFYGWSKSSKTWWTTTNWWRRKRKESKGNKTLVKRQVTVQHVQHQKGKKRKRKKKEKTRKKGNNSKSKRSKRSKRSKWARSDKRWCSTFTTSRRCWKSSGSRHCK